MELQRQCAEKIKNWVFESKKALLVKGARQVGKTYLIRSVLHELDCDYLEINLIETPSAVSLLEQTETVEDLILSEEPKFVQKRHQSNTSENVSTSENENG